MQADIRRKLAMAVRALDFAEANPATDSSYVTVVARLKERLARAEVLSIQERDGRALEQAAVGRRKELRRVMHGDQLKHLVRVAELALEDHPELSGVFFRPPFGTPLNSFITSAKAMLAAALPRKELFVQLGLGDGFLEELEKAVADFDAATETAHSSRRDHVGARGDLKAVTEECMQLTGLLDGLVRSLFRRDAERLAAWSSAKTVVRFRGPGSDASAAPEVPATPALQPTVLQGVPLETVAPVSPERAA